MAHLGTHEALMRRWFEEVWNQGREAAIDEMFEAGGLAHGLGPDPIRGPAEFKPFYRALRSAFSQLRVTVERVVESGDLAYAYCAVAATHKRTGRAVNFTGGALVRVANGRVQEAWNSWNFLDFLVQVGEVDGGAMNRAMW